MLTTHVTPLEATAQLDGVESVDITANYRT